MAFGVVCAATLLVLSYVQGSRSPWKGKKNFRRRCFNVMVIDTTNYTLDKRLIYLIMGMNYIFFCGFYRYVNAGE